MEPAPGASRAGGASTSTVAFADTNALVDDDDDDGVKTNELANGQARAATNTIDPSFMMAFRYFEAAYWRTETDRSTNGPNEKGLDRMMATRKLMKKATAVDVVGKDQRKPNPELEVDAVSGTQNLMD
jgi:hypothetical protein